MLALLACVLIAIPVAVVYLLISNAGLKRRVANLETLLARGETAPAEVHEQDAEPMSAAPLSPVGPWDASKAMDSSRQAVPKPIAASTMTASKTTTDDASLPPASPPKAVVLSDERLQTLIAWITQNWFYAISAVSLALAGIFLVLYGVEQGMLPPSVRILASFGFGAALIAAGEYIRRRYGDSEESSTAYLPSTFSGAGIVTLFGAVLAARMLYGFIGPEVALLGMALVGAIALVLGWFYGPLLAAVGVIGAMLAPFIIGGATDDPSFLLIYFGVTAIVGLAIDTIRRWAWVSVLSLILGFGTGFLLVLGAGWTVQAAFILYCGALAVAAIAIPVRGLVPDHTGAPLGLSIFARTKGDPWPEFPTRLAGGAMLAASLLIAMAAFGTARGDVFWSAVVVLSVLVLAVLVWARNAPALVDLSLLPAVALVAVVATAPRIWWHVASTAQQPEASLPLTASIIVAIGLILSGVAAWRSLRGGPGSLFLALGAAILAPALAIAMEVVWHPATTLGVYGWALHAMVISAAMVFMAERFAHADGPDARERVSFAVLSALACLAFGMLILFSTAALTSAIAMTVVVAAWLDRRFNLPLMGLYLLAGVATIGYRLVVDPGIDWALQAPLAEMLLSHGGAVVAFALSWRLIEVARRPRSGILLESAVFSSSAILLSLLLFRTIVHFSGQAGTGTHWSFGLSATIWIALGTAQLYRFERGGILMRVRALLGGLFLLLGGVQLAFAVTELNPLVSSFDNLVLGPRLINTLIPAYLLPAVTFALGAWWLPSMLRQVRVGFGVLALALSTVWLGLTIRHFWRGAMGMEWPGLDQGELYSYTVALLVLGAGIFYQALARRDALLRKAGLLVIGVAIAKVFILDINGLGGLTRVFALLFLGLALAGLAWLNRWAATRVAR
jgi:uncharacterized membrane protein